MNCRDRRYNPRRAKASTYPDLKARAKHMRHEPTEAEAVLWKALRGRRLWGFKFRRQHPILTYIVDFYCPEVGLVVEVDGAVHSRQQCADRLRQNDLEDAGLIVERFTNDEVVNGLETVLERIGRALHR